MSDTTTKIECEHHGVCTATFICRHLAEGVGCGFVASDEDPEYLWPDAWCDACDAVQREEDGWNEFSERFADIAMVCSSCYESARERNRGPESVESLTPNAASGAWEAFIQECVAHARALNERADDAFDLGKHAQWYFDSNAGTLTFSTDGRVRVIGDVQLAGSFSTNTGTWLWSWANSDNADNLVHDSRRLRVFGETRGVASMCADESIPATLEEAWEYASVATILLGGQAVYRAPMDHLHVFMILRNLRQPAAHATTGDP